MYRLYTEHEWVYPDTEIDWGDSGLALHGARGGSVCFQWLSEERLSAERPCTVSLENGGGVRLTVSQLLPATVDLNSARDRLCTKDYESVADFVTRKAPFEVFDVIRPLDGKGLTPGRIAYWVRLDIPEDAPVGEKKITLSIDGEKCEIVLTVHKAVVPLLKNARFGQINWLHIQYMDRLHGLKRGEPRRDAVLRAYLRHQLDLRNTDLQIPSGEPVYDETGKLTGFDFSEAEWVGNTALEMGFLHILGGFVARFEVWDEPTHWLLWDRKTSVATLEGYRQLKLYFEAAWDCVCRNHWNNVYIQTLVDEPQFPNSDHYRVLCSIARKFLPGVTIHDPVESTELYGGTDIWCVKQAVYEKYIDTYREIQKLGEPVWLYTCGFPGGYVMNRVMDLPLTVSRLPFWMCVLYRCAGFLHWGYNACSDEPFRITCLRPDPENQEVAYPAGNGHIVYPGEDGPYGSPRAELQRMGAEDAELLYQLIDVDPDKADAIIRSICRSFSEYDPAPSALENARIALLNALDEI